MSFASEFRRVGTCYSRDSVRLPLVRRSFGTNAVLSLTNRGLVSADIHIAEVSLEKGGEVGA